MKKFKFCSDIKLFPIAFILIILPSCGTNIKDKILTNASPQCKDYVGKYFAVVSDINEANSFIACIEITAVGGKCKCETKSLPNHDFNDGTAFPNIVDAVSRTLEFTEAPLLAASPYRLSLDTFNAILLNGALVDVLSDGCCSTGLTGCSDLANPYRLDPMSPLAGFSPDAHNAHAQPDHTYHYHGDPKALYDDSGTVVSPVIGFAADGFPIYGPWIEDAGIIREVKSSYVLQTGTRMGGCAAGTAYDGKYTSDYIFEEGSGDLDSCNGMMTVGNAYAYYLTKTYPYFMACYMGTPDASFKK